MIQFIKNIKNKSPYLYSFSMAVNHLLSKQPSWIATPIDKDRRGVRWLENSLAHFTRKRLWEKLPKEEGYITIQSGLFEGLKYWQDNPHFYVGIGYGVYEPQMQELIEKLGNGEKYQNFVNVGCAEGTYSVGMIKIWPHVTSYAYDILPDRVAITQALAELNGVADKLKTGGLFDFADPAAYPENPSLFLIDIEGAEMELVERTDFFKQHSLLIETHENMAPGVTQKLKEAFVDTHTITALNFSDIAFARRQLDFSKFTAAECADLLFCNRGVEQEFLLFESKALTA